MAGGLALLRRRDNPTRARAQVTYGEGVALLEHGQVCTSVVEELEVDRDAGPVARSTPRSPEAVRLRPEVPPPQGGSHSTDRYCG